MLILYYQPIDAISHISLPIVLFCLFYLGIYYFPYTGSIHCLYSLYYVAI